MDQLQRFIDLVNKTGDKLVIYDRYQPDNSCVILGINAYEAMIDRANTLGDLTEEELADKINRDIAIWKNEHILSDANEDEFDWSETDIDEVPDLFEESFENEIPTDEVVEEISYLYPEPEAVPFVQVETETESDPVPEDDDDNYSETEPKVTEAQAPKSDFQSLGDILESKFERGNNWTIPSDRKRQAVDETASRYETIGF